MADELMKLERWNASTGAHEAVLFEEGDPQWIEPQSPALFLPDGSGDFLWFSPRNGYRNLYRYRLDGTLVGPATTFDFDVREFIGFDAQGTGFHVVASKNPLQEHVHHVQLGGASRRLTTGRGHHKVAIAPTGAHLLDTHNNLRLPLAIDLVEVETGKAVRRVLEASNPLTEYAITKDLLFRAQNEDGDTLYGWLLLPPGHDPTTKPPLIQYVYGGPHSQLVTDQFMQGGGRWNQWLLHLAHKGYVVAIVDNRGTNWRGAEFAQAIHRKLGTLEVADQTAGLERALELSGADPQRVGVTGWSYGGFMTLSLMTRAGDRYAAGVAGAPVTDWAYYETGYGERYMDTPAENPDGYKTANPGNHIDGLQGELLLVHGTLDVTVMFQSSLQFLRKAVGASKPLSFFAYPGEAHGLRGKNFSHFLKMATQHFDRVLGMD